MDVIEGELEGFVARSQWTRRGFVMTSLATGFALSVQPVSAQTIHTDATGLEAGEVKVPVADGSIPAYRAMPDTGGPFPTVLVVHEIFGRARAHPGHLPAPRQARLLRDRARTLRPRGQCGAKSPTCKEMITNDCRQGAGRSGAVGSRCHPGLRQGIRQSRSLQARGHRVLLGRPDHLALRGAPARAEGSGRLVRHRSCHIPS